MDDKQPEADKQADVSNDTERELTFGEQAVGLTFNPSRDKKVDDCKKAYADIIDNLNDLREASMDPDVKRMVAVAITEAQTSQMWAVKALTWKS